MRPYKALALLLGQNSNNGISLYEMPQSLYSGSAFSKRITLSNKISYHDNTIKTFNEVLVTNY